MKKRILASLLSFCLLVGLLPAAAMAADETGTAENPTMITATTTITENGVYQLADNMGAGTVVTIQQGLSVTIIGAADGEKKDVSIVANKNVDLTIQNLQITPNNRSAIQFNDGGTLQIAGENYLIGGVGGSLDCGAVDIRGGIVTLKAADASEASASIMTHTGGYGAGIRVKPNAEVCIESGNWAVTSDSSGAAIGGTGVYIGTAENFGTIKIAGGTVTAVSNNNGSAIGAGGSPAAGTSGGSGTIEITGGSVMATAAKGAAIGTGLNSSGGISPDLEITTTIAGGAVTVDGKVQSNITIKDNGALTLNKSTSYAPVDKAAVTLEGGTLTISKGAVISGDYSVNMTDGDLVAENDFTVKGASAPLISTILAGGELTADESGYTLCGTMTDTTLNSGTLTVDKDSTLNGDTAIKSGATLVLENGTGADDALAATISGSATVESGATISGTGFVTGTLDVTDATTDGVGTLYTVGSNANVIGLSDEKVQEGGNKTVLHFTDYAGREFTLTVGSASYSGTTGADSTADIYALAAKDTDIVLKRDDNISFSGKATILGTNKHDDSKDNTIDVSSLTAMAPVVASITPKDNAENIATSTTEIVLTFDQEVTADSVKAVSIQERSSSTATSYTSYTCMMKPEYIETDAEQHISTVTLPISAFATGSGKLRLSANRHYTLVLNDGTFTGNVGNETDSASYSFTTASGVSVKVELTSGGSIQGTVSGSGYTIKGAGTYSVASGSSIDFTAKPNSGYKLDKVEVTRGSSPTTEIPVEEDGVSFTVSDLTDTTAATTIKVSFVPDAGFGTITLEPATEKGITLAEDVTKSAYFTTDPKDLALTASSADPDIATVSGVGTSGQRRFVNVTGVSEGETTIYLLKTDGTATPFHVTVTAAPEEDPTITTSPATGIGASTATLHGHVDANGHIIRSAGFRIMSYGGNYLRTQGSYDAATGTITATISTLSPNTTYYYHAYVDTDAGTYYGNSTGLINNDESFKTEMQDDTDAQKPVISQVSPAAGSVIPTSGSFTVAFSKPMYGAPRVTNGAAELSEDGSSMTVTYSGLEYSTEYTFVISGITDRAGNKLESSTIGYTTEARPASTYADITAATLTVDGVNYTGSITEDAVSFTVPNGTDVTALVPSFTLSEGASISPMDAQDFSKGAVIYTVTAADGVTTREYSVTVAVAEADTYLVNVAETAHGTVSVDPSFAAEGDEITVTVTPDTGYELADLYYSYEGVDDTEITDGKFTMPASDVTVTAIFEAIKYSITYNLDGGSKNDQATYTVEDLPMTLTAPTKSGCTFVGWTGEGISTPTAEVTLAEGTTGGRTYTAHWNEDPAPALSISANKTSFTGGGTVTLTVSNASGAVTVTCDNGISVSGSGSTWTANLPNSNATYTFTATDGSGASATCTVTVAYQGGGSSGGGGGSSSPSYAITVDAGKHGEVTVSPKRADKGDTVTITVKPDEGYELDELTATDRKGDELKLTEKSDTKFTFKMPGSKVTVEASFVPTADPDIPQADFIDVPANAWYADAVQYVYEKGLMAGTGEDTFAPDRTTTRGMIVTILYRLEGSPKASGSSAFTDVAEGDWYADAIKWAASEGVVGGYGNGKFGPNDPITREQLASILWRYAGSPAVSGMALNEFADHAAISAYAVEAMRWAVSDGLISGTGNNILAPQGNATRAQVAVILMRYVENLTK